MAKIKQIKKNPSPDEIEIGDQVKHKKFGVGTVLYKSGTGDRAKAIVVFAEEGQKKLLLKYAGLKKVKETPPEEETPAEEGGEVSEEEILKSLDEDDMEDDEDIEEGDEELEDGGEILEIEDDEDEEDD